MLWQSYEYKMYLQIFFNRFKKNNGDISPTSDNRRLFPCAPSFLPPHPMLQEGHNATNYKYPIFD